MDILVAEGLEKAFYERITRLSLSLMHLFILAYTV